MGREQGISEEQLLELASYEQSSAFDDLEKRILDLAVGMTSTPAAVADEVITNLRKHFDEEQLVELVASIGWENYRARFNHSFGIESANFSEGAFCPMPER